MNVASLDLCKELYELSKWADTYMMWGNDDESNDRVLKNDLYMGVDYLAPAYDLGYLLRKLPYKLDNNKFLQVSMGSVSAVARYGAVGQAKLSLIKRADTPENALCKLAIELFKQGVLTAGGPQQ